MSEPAAGVSCSDARAHRTAYAVTHSAKTPSPSITYLPSRDGAREHAARPRYPAVLVLSRADASVARVVQAVPGCWVQLRSWAHAILRIDRI